jgi:flagellar hook-length control protein FliK
VNPAVDAAAAAGPISGTGFPGKDVARSADDSDPDGPVPGQVAFQAPQPVPPATATATSAPATAGVPAALSTQVAEQVNRQLLGARALRDGSHRAVIRLSPEHLGDVTITLNVHAGSVRMDLLAGPTAIGALQANLHDLRDQMAQSGLRLDDVSLRQSGLPNTDAGASNGQNTPQGNPGPPSRGDSGERRAGPGAIGVTPPGSGSRPARPSSGNRLDVLI